MPKIEIELYEIEKLNKEIKQLKTERTDLEKKLKPFSINVANKKAVQLSLTLFNQYMGCIFRELGFDNDIELKNGVQQSASIWMRDHEALCNDKNIHINNPDFFEVDTVIGATITNKFKRAFINLTINVK